MNKLNVLSLFDGISSGRVALERAGIGVGHFFASELDPYAIKIVKNNWPDTIQLGDVQNWKNWAIKWESLDLILAGPPCQSFSLLGDQKGFGDDRGNLMTTFFEILNYAKIKNPNVKFLMENVKMKPVFIQEITNKLGVEPIKLNSSEFCPQSRTRYYWSNFIWSPIKYACECNIDENEEAYCTDCDMDYAYCDCIGPHEDRVIFDEAYENGFRLQEEARKINFEQGYFPATVRKGDPRMVIFTELFGCLTASYYKGIRSDGRPALAKKEGEFNILRETGDIRILTPEECEELQGFPEGYTKGVSNTQRYKTIGNGWCVDVVTHIFKRLK
jgi:DNA-cytosine methyltransferase